MAISDQQFETWAKQGAVTTSKATGDSIKNAIKSYDDFPAGLSFDVYLQGSYKNGTNIYSESDVDVVVEMTSPFRNNLNQTQKEKLGLIKSDIHLSQFRKHVLECLSKKYGLENLESSNKVIKLAPSSNRRSADILICQTYRSYYELSPNGYYSGVRFKTIITNKEIIAYPKIHSKNATKKNQDTDGNFKPLVRIFKNMKRTLVAKNELGPKEVPSYFIECFLGNVADLKFKGSYRNQFISVYNYLDSNTWDDFVRLNRIRSIWGKDKESWSKELAEKFLNQIAKLYNE